MKKIAKVLAKIGRFITLIGVVFFVLLNVYVFVVPYFREKFLSVSRIKRRQQLEK